ncbi:SDR family NAD(P)-dependent oxidoreductase, partial [Cupriavidus sp. 2MCAB6]|uniref:SDR family NAD(P)-dependent oxidoreductase n=1 Tax=Cupriavidus sp. 2MCAB6 TaxID=3232981 RepID=UPI003F8F6E5F
SPAKPNSATNSAIQQQRRIQRQVARSDAKPAEAKSGAMQAGARRYPEPPFRKQHQAKPGSEAVLDPAPMYDAPYYKGSGKLEGKVAIITGGDSGIGRSVAVLFAREGADVAILHLGEAGDAKVTGQAIEAEGRRCLVIPGDVRDSGFCRKAVAKVVKTFGKLDVLVNNAAFQVHSPRFEDLS